MAHKSTAILFGSIVLILSMPCRGFTQSSGELDTLRKDLEALKAEQAAIQKELQEIKQLLRARPKPIPAEPQNVVLSVEGAPFKGDPHAKLTLIDFSDYQ